MVFWMVKIQPKLATSWISSVYVERPTCEAKTTQDEDATADGWQRKGSHSGYSWWFAIMGKNHIIITHVPSPSSGHAGLKIR